MFPVKVPLPMGGISPGMPNAPASAGQEACFFVWIWLRRKQNRYDDFCGQKKKLDSIHKKTDERRNKTPVKLAITEKNI